MEENYLKLPADQLLEKFGEGSHVPGSGSAAAFSGLLGVELMRTVCKLTLKREEDKYVQVRREFTIILEQVEKVKFALVELFEEDASIFNDVSKYRVLRNKAKENKNDKDERKYSKLANDKLKDATEVPLEIARTCLNLIDYGFTIFDKGFQSARGDSGVAISNLLSAISGSLFVTLLNIRPGRKSQWTEKLREDAEKIGQSYNAKQKLALTKVLDLYKEGIDIKDYQLKLNFE